MACRLETRQGCLHRITRCGRTRRDSALTPEKRQSRRGSQAFRELLLGGRETGARVLLLRPRSRRFSTCALLLRPPVAAGFPTCVLLAHTSWFSTRSVRAGKKPAPTCVPRCAGFTRRPRSRRFPTCALLAHVSWFPTRSVRAGKKPARTGFPRCAGVTPPCTYAPLAVRWLHAAARPLRRPAPRRSGVGRRPSAAPGSCGRPSG